MKLSIVPQFHALMTSLQHHLRALRRIQLLESAWLEHVRQRSGDGKQQLTIWLRRLSPRERLSLGVAGVVGGGVLLYVGLVEPLWDMHARLHARLAAKEKELGEIVALRQRYQNLSRQTAREASPRTLTSSPFSFLETLATSALGPGKVSSINPVGREQHPDGERETIEMHLQGVSLQELIDLLYKVDAVGTVLRPVRLSIKKQYKDPYRFDVTLTTSAQSRP